MTSAGLLRTGVKLSPAHEQRGYRAGRGSRARGLNQAVSRWVM